MLSQCDGKPSISRCLDHDTKGRKITVNEAEAERVCTIFRRYLKLGSLNLLLAAEIILLR
jgi:hypothetical protein